MFPSPRIEKSTPGVRIRAGYNVLLPIALVIWLLPLIAIFLTSIRPGADINAGNIFGWPSDFRLLENYTAVFNRSKAVEYMWNSVKITLPSTAIAVAISCLTGYALSVYRFRLAVPLFFIFVAGNFVPFQILMVPVRDFSVQTGLYNTLTGLVLFHAAFQTGFCTLFMRNFMKALPLRTDRVRTDRGRLRMEDLLVRGDAAGPSSRGGPVGADLHLRLERLLLGNRADQW